MEQTLVALWREVLDDPALDADDNFFLAGGHSLLALRLLERVREALGHTVELDELLDAATPRALARHLAVLESGDVRRPGTGSTIAAGTAAESGARYEGRADG
ncbi:phosphopantetheine-binding protein [Streptomyces sp. NPDC059605]|uniref:phosphopantetheine-binding protein n=1 Tax=unclassified Streptomyces TaxID=2593676 RepID=UPI0033B060A0